MKRTITYLTAAAICAATLPAAGATSLPAHQPETARAVINRPNANFDETWQQLLHQFGIPGSSNHSGSADAGSSNSNFNSNNSGSSNGGSANTSYANQVASLVNQQRAKNGLPALKVDAAMSRAAQVRANELRTSFSHTRPNGARGLTALQEAGVSYHTAGENIAAGQRTPQAVMNAWMNSAGHRANILSRKYGRIGIGSVTVGGQTYWVQLFAD